MRLKALIIDDETNILKNLQIVIPWSDLEIDVIGLAKNGALALEFVTSHHPDLILCDIRMPVMDGISFLERFRERETDTDKDTEVIMLTGYQDFEYARSVMKYGVRDYILKPINYDELTSVVERLSRGIRERRREKNSKEVRMGKAMHLAYEKMMYDVLMDYSSVHATYLPYDEEQDAERLRYRMMLADFDDYSHKCRSSNEYERKLWNFAVRNVLQEALLTEGLRYAVLQMREGEWCILVECDVSDETATQEEMMAWAEILQNAVTDNVKINISIGIHTAQAELHELSRLFRSLQRTVHLASGKDRSILLMKEVDGTEDNQEMLWKSLEQLVSVLKRNDSGGVDEALRQLTERFQSSSGRSITRVEKIAHFIVLHLLREMRELGVLSEDKEREIWAIIEQANRVKDMLAIMHRIVSISQEASAGKKTVDLLMHSAKDYIGRNLSRDLGIDELADYLGISASYFSLLFKQQFGSTFVEYLTAERMELAKSQLLLTNKSVTDIGRSVGYAERRYFTKVFHKVTGEIPSEYREKRK